MEFAPPEIARKVVKKEPKEPKTKGSKVEVKKEPLEVDKEVKKPATKKKKKILTKAERERKEEIDKIMKNENLTEQEKLLQIHKGPFVRVSGTVQDPVWTNVVNNTTDKLNRFEETEPDLDAITRVTGEF